MVDWAVEAGLRIGCVDDDGLWFEGDDLLHRLAVASIDDAKIERLRPRLQAAVDTLCKEGVTGQHDHSWFGHRLLTTQSNTISRLMEVK